MDAERVLSDVIYMGDMKAEMVDAIKEFVESVKSMAESVAVMSERIGQFRDDLIEIKNIIKVSSKTFIGVGDCPSCSRIARVYRNPDNNITGSMYNATCRHCGVSNDYGSLPYNFEAVSS